MKRSSRARRTRAPKVYDVPTATKSLVLVRRIVADLVAAIQALDRLPREDVSPAVRHERADLSAKIEEYRHELKELGLHLLHRHTGTVGFPTLVNGQLAYLVFRADEPGLVHWRYRHQNRLRPIPASWLEAETRAGLEKAPAV